MKYGGHHDIARKPDNDNGDASDEKKHDEVWFKKHRNNFNFIFEFNK